VLFSRGKLRCFLLVKITRAVEQLIEQKPFIQEALAKGIINYASLADEIMDDVQRETGVKVNHSAVMMALRRLGDKLKETFVVKSKFGEADISIKSNLLSLTFPFTPKYVNVLASLKQNVKRGSFFSFVIGINEITLVCSEQIYEEIKDEIKKVGDVLKTKKKLSALTLNVSSINTFMFYLASRALNWENVGIVETFSTNSEITFVIASEDVSKGFNALQKLIAK